MKHPTDELIITYLYKETNAVETGEMEKHIAECGDCAQKIDGIKKTIFDIDQMDDSSTPEFLENKLADFFDKLSSLDKPYKESRETPANSNPVKKSTESGLKSIETSGHTHDDIMTPADLARFLKLSVNSIYDLLNEIPHLVLAGQIRFRRSSINKWLDSREKNASAKILSHRGFDDSVKLRRNVI